MTTSGITNIEMNRATIVAAALRKIGAIALGQTPAATEITNATEALNNLVAEFQTLGMPLWSEKQLVIPMIASQRQYIIGVGLAVNSAFPLKVLQAWTLDNAGGSRQELFPNSIDVYNRLPQNTASTGFPSQYMYQPKINFGELNLWPTPDATTVSSKTLTIQYIAPFDVFNADANTPYFPREWNNALVYGLAALLAPEYGVPLNDRGFLNKEAIEHREMALDFGLEYASITFAPMENWSYGHTR